MTTPGACRPGPAAGRARRAAGFVLPVTVMLLALVSVGVAVMAQRSDQMRQLVTASRQEQAAAAAAHNALAQAQFLTSTLLRRGSRLGDIELDGRFYRTADGTFVSYTDAGALLNLNRPSSREVTGLLVALGVPEPEAERLSDTLLDYIDADSLVRPGGAEAPEYARAGLPAPRNAGLLGGAELQRVMGWQALDPRILQRLLDLVYVGPLNAVNRYTVKAPVLAAIGGVDIATAENLVAQRAMGTPIPVESLPNVARGSFLSVSRYIALPSATIILTICPQSVAWCQHTSLTATGESAEGPWHLDGSTRRMRTQPLPAPNDVAPLPDQQPADAPPPMVTPFGVLR